MLGFSPRQSGSPTGRVAHGPAGEAATERVGACEWQELLQTLHSLVMPSEQWHELKPPRSPATVMRTSSPVGARTTSGSCANGGSTVSFCTYGPVAPRVEMACTTALFRRYDKIPQ